MGYRIPEETIEKIRQSVDIVDVVGEYVQLKKQGRNYFGLCPFHGENTPSFSVAPDKQIYHCFGCGAGGNVFSFLMEIEGYPFIEAVQRIGEKENIELPDIQGASFNKLNSKQSKETSIMLEAHDLLRKFYHHLLVNTKEGQKALDYLLQRGFTREVIDKFEIGYSLDSWDFITKFFSKRGFLLQTVEKSGLISKRDSTGTYFDRFRNRIMFPIWDHQGNTIAFSGRILGNGEPKYLNSPETLIFTKSKILYNFHHARLHIRKNQQAILFEGYVDVIAADRSGVKHSIATMGTSLTEEQIRMIRRNVESVIICYDSDKAGTDATFRAAKLLSDAGCSVKIAVMPMGLDPDDYIRKYGADKFKSDVIGASVTLMAFKMMYLRKEKNLQDEGERIRYIEDVLKEISDLDKAVERDHYLRQLATEFSISLEALKQQQFQIYKSQRNKKDNGTWNRNNKAKITNVQKKLLPAYHTAERMLIAHMLKNKEIALKIQDMIQGNFNIEEHRAIAAYLYAYYEEGNDPNVSSFIHRINDGKLHQVVSDIAMMSINENFSDKELTDYIKQVLNYQKLLKIKEKETEKIDAERQKDFVNAAKIAMEIIQMKRALK